jgi:hypothetical protein
MLSRPLLLPLLIGTGFAVISAASSTAIQPPPFPIDSITPTLRSKPVTRLLMGQFAVSLETTSLPNVQKTVGVGSVSFFGDGAEATSWLCYTLDNSVPHQRLWIMSNAEMGGPQKLVDGIVVQLAAGADSTSDCPSLPTRFQPLVFDHAILLGIREESVRSIFGSPSKILGHWEDYSYAGRTRSDGKCAPDGYDVSTGLTIKIENGLVIEIHVGQTTSC